MQSLLFTNVEKLQYKGTLFSKEESQQKNLSASYYLAVLCKVTAVSRFYF